MSDMAFGDRRRGESNEAWHTRMGEQGYIRCHNHVIPTYVEKPVSEWTKFERMREAREGAVGAGMAGYSLAWKRCGLVGAGQLRRPKKLCGMPGRANGRS
jgi:hypothetical protein